MNISSSNYSVNYLQNLALQSNRNLNTTSATSSTNNKVTSSGVSSDFGDILELSQQGLQASEQAQRPPQISKAEMEKRKTSLDSVKEKLKNIDSIEDLSDVDAKKILNDIKEKLGFIPGTDTSNTSNSTIDTMSTSEIKSKLSDIKEHMNQNGMPPMGGPGGKPPMGPPPKAKEVSSSSDSSESTSNTDSTEDTQYEILQKMIESIKNNYNSNQGTKGDYVAEIQKRANAISKYSGSNPYEEDTLSNVLEQLGQWSSSETQGIGA